MKYLLIVRHAKADSNYKLKDFDRPLNEHGIKDAILMANKLIENSFSPDLIISSGANRALTTSKIVSEVLKYPINHFINLPTSKEITIFVLIPHVRNVRFRDDDVS